MSIFRWSDYTRKKEIPKKTKLPTNSKSKVKYCRNCNCKNTSSAKCCKQCDMSLVNASKKPRR